MLKYASNFLSPEGRTAMLEILNSETAKRRMRNGNQQLLVESLQSLEGASWELYKHHAMFFNRWGDIMPIITTGQGIYRLGTYLYFWFFPRKSNMLFF